jgi:hypothetical protein
MAKVPSDTKTGFLIGLGLLAAFLVWGLVSMAAGRAIGAAGGKGG